MYKCDLCGKQEKFTNEVFYHEEQYNLCKSHHRKWLKHHKSYIDSHKNIKTCTIKTCTKAWEKMYEEEEKLFKEWFEEQQSIKKKWK